MNKHTIIEIQSVKDKLEHHRAKASIEIARKKRVNKIARILSIIWLTLLAVFIICAILYSIIESGELKTFLVSMIIMVITFKSLEKVLE